MAYRQSYVALGFTTDMFTKSTSFKKKGQAEIFQSAWDSPAHLKQQMADRT